MLHWHQQVRLKALHSLTRCAGASRSGIKLDEWPLAGQTEGIALSTMLHWHQHGQTESRHSPVCSAFVPTQCIDTNTVHEQHACLPPVQKYQHFIATNTALPCLERISTNTSRRDGAIKCLSHANIRCPDCCNCWY
eukprot:1161785-Pelagomonas_calceolata.AAC.16